MPTDLGFISKEVMIEAIPVRTSFSNRCSASMGTKSDPSSTLYFQRTSVFKIMFVVNLQLIISSSIIIAIIIPTFATTM